VDGWILVKLFDQLQQLLLAGLAAKPVYMAIQADPLAGFFLVPNVDLTGRKIADQNCGQRRADSTMVDKCRDLAG